MNNQGSTENLFSNESVPSLVIRAREGSQDAFSELRSRYKPLIESQVLKHKLEGMSSQDVEDLREEAIVVFCNAVCNYDPAAFEVEFGLYAKICIQNGLISFARSFMRRKKSLPLSLDNASERERADEGVDFLQSLVSKENTAELVRIISKNLSDYENRVWWMYVSGMSVSDITRALGYTEAKSVSNAVYRIRKKLRGFILDRDKIE